MNRYETTARKILTKVLLRESRPLLVSEISVLVAREHVPLDKSTLYRNLNLFVAEGKVKKILLLDRNARFEWTARHHHHFSCTNCDRISEIKHCDLTHITEKLQKGGYKTVEHNLEFVGVCRDCSKKRSSS